MSLFSNNKGGGGTSPTLKRGETVVGSGGGTGAGSGGLFGSKDGASGGTGGSGLFAGGNKSGSSPLFGTGSGGGTGTGTGTGAGTGSLFGNKPAGTSSGSIFGGGGTTGTTGSTGTGGLFGGGGGGTTGGKSIFGGTTTGTGGSLFGSGGGTGSSILGGTGAGGPPKKITFENVQGDPYMAAALREMALWTYDFKTFLGHIKLNENNRLKDMKVDDVVQDNFKEDLKKYWRAVKNLDEPIGQVRASLDESEGHLKRIRENLSESTQVIKVFQSQVVYAHYIMEEIKADVLTLKEWIGDIDFFSDNLKKGRLQGNYFRRTIPSQFIVRLSEKLNARMATLLGRMQELEHIASTKLMKNDFTDENLDPVFMVLEELYRNFLSVSSAVFATDELFQGIKSEFVEEMRRSGHYNIANMFKSDLYALDSKMELMASVANSLKPKQSTTTTK